MRPGLRTLSSQVALHLRYHDGQVQQRPAQGAVLVNRLSEANHPYLALPQLAQRFQHLRQRTSQPVQGRYLHAVAGLKGGL